MRKIDQGSDRRELLKLVNAPAPGWCWQRFTRKRWRTHRRRGLCGCSVPSRPPASTRSCARRWKRAAMPPRFRSPSTPRRQTTIRATRPRYTDAKLTVPTRFHGRVLAVRGRGVASRLKWPRCRPPRRAGVATGRRDRQGDDLAAGSCLRAPRPAWAKGANHSGALATRAREIRAAGPPIRRDGPFESTPNDHVLGSRGGRLPASFIARLSARHLAREAVRSVAAAAAQPPGRRAPPARHHQVRFRQSAAPARHPNQRVIASAGG